MPFFRDHIGSSLKQNSFAAGVTPSYRDASRRSLPICPFSNPPHLSPISRRHNRLILFSILFDIPCRRNTRMTMTTSAVGSFRTCLIWRARSASEWIVLQKSFWGGEQKILRAADRFRTRRYEGPHRFTQNDHGASYRRCGVMQWRRRLKINFCEIFGVVQFSTFATISGEKQTSYYSMCDWPLLAAGSIGQRNTLIFSKDGVWT